MAGDVICSLREYTLGSGSGTDRAMVHNVALIRGRGLPPPPYLFAQQSKDQVDAYNRTGKQRKVGDQV